MTNKKQVKPTDSFMAYTFYIKEELERQLTTKEIQFCMSSYITSVNVDKCIEKLQKGENK